MPTAAGPTIWEMKFPIRKKPWRLLNEWDLELRDCYAGRSFAPRFYRAARNHFRAAIFPSSRFPICSSRFARTRPCTGTRPGTMCSRIAVIRRIRWAAWSFICAGIAMRSGSGFPMRRARRCSSRISGRTSRATSRRGASTFRSRRLPRTASRKTISCSAGSTRDTFR